jgi:hypothetical protein
MGKIVGIVASVLVVAAAGGLLWKFHARLMPKPQIQHAKELAVNTQAAPSTFAKSGMLEDVVKEVSEEGRPISADGTLHLSYDDLSFSEKIDYEVLFAKNIVELLAEAVPAGIGLRALQTDNFQTVYAVGLAPSRELVEDVFATLKSHNVTLLPRPLTQITPNGKDGYRFAFTGKVEFGLNITDSIVAAPMPSNDNLSAVLALFEKCAADNSISIVKKPSQISSEKVGAYFRHLYGWSGEGSYKNFAKFVVRLHQARQFFAFKRIVISAVTGANIKIESQVILTARE